MGNPPGQGSNKGEKPKQKKKGKNKLKAQEENEKKSGEEFRKKVGNASVQLDIMDVPECKAYKSGSVDSSVCKTCNIMHFNGILKFDSGFTGESRVLFCFHMKAIDSIKYGNAFLKDLVGKAKTEGEELTVKYGGLAFSTKGVFSKDGYLDYDPKYAEKTNPNNFLEPTQGILQREKKYFRVGENREILPISKTYVYLFHELVHFYHFLQGSFDYTFVEEEKTVGLYEYEFKKEYSENNFRKELLIVRRPCYKYRYDENSDEYDGFFLSKLPKYYNTEKDLRKKWGRPEQRNIPQNSYEYCHREEKDMKDPNWQCNKHLKAYMEKNGIKSW